MSEWASSTRSARAGDRPRLLEAGRLPVIGLRTRLGSGLPFVLAGTPVMIARGQRTDRRRLVSAT